MFATGRLLGLAADVLADQLPEAAFRSLSELVVVRRLLAHHEAPATVAGIEPLRSRSGSAVRTIEPYPRAHLDEGTALWKLSWFFVFDAHEYRALVILQHPNRTHGNFIASFGLSDGSPLACS